MRGERLTSSPSRPENPATPLLLGPPAAVTAFRVFFSFASIEFCWLLISESKVLETVAKSNA